MFEKFTERAIKVLNFAQEEAKDLGYSTLLPEHLVLGILKESTSISAKMLAVSGMNFNNFKQTLKEKSVHASISSSITFSAAVVRILKKAKEKSEEFGVNYVAHEHLFLCLLDTNNTDLNQLFEKYNVNIEKLKLNIENVIKKKKSKPHPEFRKNNHSILPRYFVIPSIFEEKDSVDVMNIAKNKITESNLETLGTEQLLLSMLENSETPIFKILSEEGISQEKITQILSTINSRKDEYNEAPCQFTPSAFYAVNSAYEQAKELGVALIKPEHLLMGILKEKKGLAYRALKELNINVDNLYSKLVKPIENQKPTTLTVIKLST